MVVLIKESEKLHLDGCTDSDSGKDQCPGNCQNFEIPSFPSSKWLKMTGKRHPLDETHHHTVCAAKSALLAMFYYCIHQWRRTKERMKEKNEREGAREDLLLLSLFLLATGMRSSSLCHSSFWVRARARSVLHGDGTGKPRPKPELASLPESPFDPKSWVEQIIDNYRAASVGRWPSLPTTLHKQSHSQN